MIDSGSVTESLREQVMIAQFQGATGCTREQARQLLQNARWEFQTALSMFFQECTIQPPQQQAVAMVTGGTTPTAQSMFAQNYRNAPVGGHLGTACAPCNTPATPPNFPEALLALQKLQAGGADWSAAASPPINTSWQQQQQTPKVLASFNPMPPPSDR